MAALTHERANPDINPSDFPGEAYPTANNGGSFAGGLVGLNAAGYLDSIPGPNVMNVAFRFRGYSHRTWANVAQGDGAFVERVDRPQIIQGLQVLASDPVTEADLGNQVFIEDNQTIRRTSNTNTRCLFGILQAINLDGTVNCKPLQP